MKLKQRTKIACISVVLLCLFATSFFTNAKPSIDSITFDETVEIGKTFEVNVKFAYATSRDCIFNRFITLYYAVGTDPVLDYTQKIITAIDVLPDYPRPTNVITRVNLSKITCAVNDTFIFKIKWAKGYIYNFDLTLDGSMACVGTAYSEMYELTIVKAKRVSIPIWSIIITLLILFDITLKKRNKNISDPT